MSLAQAFTIDLGHAMTRIETENKCFKYDPPVMLEAGVKYAFDIKTGALFRVIGKHMERIATSAN